jgi:cell division protein FtsB
MPPGPPSAEGSDVASLLATRERRYIYNGDPQDKVPGYAVRPANRRVRSPRKRRTFNIVAALFLAALGAVAYISNLLAVQHLTVEVHDLQQRYQKINNTNAMLRAEISRKAALERIGIIATQELGLMYPKERPEQLDVDAGRMEQFGNR